jgi:hypothetical protein
MLICLIAIAASAPASAAGAPARLSQDRPLIKDFVGLNGHTVQFKPKLYAPTCRLARDYHPVDWDLGKETDVLPPFPFAKNRVHWEHVYGSWTAEGFDINVSLMFESIPQKDWKDVARDAHAYGKAFAKAFGPSSPKALVRAAEVGNEPGKWDDPSYRAMFEAMAKGLREGDPKLKVVTCAMIAGKSHDYAKNLDCVKGLEALYDVLNVHAYALIEGWPTWRRSYPEDPKLIEYLGHMEGVIGWRNEHAKGKPVWLTEFGYDSSTKEPPKTGDFAKWVGVNDTQQAQWILRSIFVFTAMEIERAYIYFFDDKDEPSFHASSGITRNGQPKPSYHALAHLQAALGEYRFARVREKKEGELYAYEYKSGPKTVVVAWSPTGGGRTTTYAPGGKILKAERMPLAPGPAPTVEVKDGVVPIDESPTYIYLE